MSGAAQRKDTTEALDFDAVEAAAQDAREVPSVAVGLKEAVAERLAAHRSRRAAQQELAAQAGLLRGTGSPSRRASSQVREAVAARYEQSVSYREFLAAEAERALERAQAEAEVAARNARAVAEAKLQLMEEIEHWNRSEDREESGRRQESAFVEARADAFVGGLSVQLYEDAGRSGSAVSPVNPASSTTAWNRLATAAEDSDEELRALEQEIEFRHAPELEPYAVEALPIPGNLIEFPRQLVASRKARPRLAEGPLREDAPAEPQLRIFEVDAEQISMEPEADPAAAPEWQNMLLDATTVVAPTAPLEAQLQFTLQPQTASVELRLMAAAVDLIWIGAGFVGFAAVAVEMAGRSLRLLPVSLLGASAAASLVLLYVVYQMLFFSLSGDTPGMRYARIGLCTFGDRNPTRRAMRRRVLATLLAACPLGLGLAWACLDEERLGWHDRMSRMYQRAY